MINIFEHIVNSIFTDFLNPKSNQGLELITKEDTSSLHEATKYLHLISQFFILLGVLTSLSTQKQIKGTEYKIKNKYLEFSVVYFMVLVAGIIVPFFASAINTSRLYHIALIFLSPFFVIGGRTFFKSLFRSGFGVWDKYSQVSLKILSMFVGVFLLFNSGFMYEIANDGPTSISLSNIEDTLQFNEQEITGAKWLSASRSEELVFGDQPSWLLLSETVDLGFANRISANTVYVPQDTYIYLRSRNIRDQKIAVMKERSVQYYVNIQDSQLYKKVIIYRNKIYDNADAQIYE